MRFLKVYILIALVTVFAFSDEYTPYSHADSLNFDNKHSYDVKCSYGDINNSTSISIPKNESNSEQNIEIDWEVIAAAIIGIIGILITVYSSRRLETNNIIRSARISWAQELRRTFSELPYLIGKIILNYKLFITKNKGIESDYSRKEWQDFLQEHVEELSKIEQICYYAMLHLNPDEKNSEHKYLKMLISEMSNAVSIEGFKKGYFDDESKMQELMKEASWVIKKAWEDAKNRDSIGKRSNKR